MFQNFYMNILSLGCPSYNHRRCNAYINFIILIISQISNDIQNMVQLGSQGLKESRWFNPWTGWESESENCHC